MKILANWGGAHLMNRERGGGGGVEVVHVGLIGLPTAVR